MEALRDRGVEAFGIDISEYAIGEVRPTSSRTAASPRSSSPRRPLRPDHLHRGPRAPERGRRAARHRQYLPEPRRTSSSRRRPTTSTEPTHVNVRPRSWWIERFAEHGFRPRRGLRRRLRRGARDAVPRGPAARPEPPRPRYSVAASGHPSLRRETRSASCCDRRVPRRRNGDRLAGLHGASDRASSAARRDRLQPGRPRGGTSRREQLADPRVRNALRPQGARRARPRSPPTRALARPRMPS